MKLRSRKSEYQHRFASPSKEYFQSVYEEQLTYRLKRRQEECGHHAIQWDPESSEENSENEKQRVNETEEIKSQSEICDSVVSPNIDNSEAAVSVTSKEAAKSDESIKNTNEGNNLPKRKKNCPKKCRSRSRSVEHPPFISYGWADSQPETGRQRTHNIKAPKTAVYPAALKRLHYINAERKKQRERSESRASTPAAVPLYQKNQSDSSLWMSEYQRCYSSQSSRPKSAPTRKKKTSKTRKFQSSRGLPR